MRTSAWRGLHASLCVCGGGEAWGEGKGGGRRRKGGRRMTIGSGRHEHRDEMENSQQRGSTSRRGGGGGHHRNTREATAKDRPSPFPLHFPALPEFSGCPSLTPYCRVEAPNSALLSSAFAPWPAVEEPKSLLREKKALKADNNKTTER